MQWNVTCGFAAAFVLTATAAGAQIEGTADGEWPTYGGNLSANRYSPLDQIDAANFADLEVAWRLSTDNFGPEPESRLQVTPLMVDGVLYATAGTRRVAIAIDAASGELLWMHRVDEGERGKKAPRKLSGRGLTYWDDGSHGVILYVTPGYQLVALNAVTGRPVAHLGSDGIIDLKQNIDQDLEPTSEIGLHAAPIVAGDTLLVGAAHLPGSSPKSRTNVKGYFRGFNLQTGDQKWIFHTIPDADEFGNETWLEGSWRYTGNTGVWAQMTVDPSLNMAFVPVEAPTNDYYGGHRPGDNLFSSSIVAVDLDTGERVWHFQIVHHDIWDWDLPAAPILADLTVDGRDVKAVVLPTKQSYFFVFNRETGEPVWPIEEVPVEQGNVPGEWYSPTQPIPTKPPPVDRVEWSLADLVDYTPELRERAEAIVSRYKIGSLYTPPIVATADGKLGIIKFPHSLGGINWPGSAFDPETGMLYTYSQSLLGALGLVNDSERSDMDFIADFSAGGFALTTNGFPLVKPPWARITAVDLTHGEIAWQVPHGYAPDNIRNHPLLEGHQLPKTGWFGRIGTLVTKTLVVAGDAALYTTETGEVGSMLRAYDKATGEEVGAVYMPAPQTGSPMTYSIDGRQYIVVATSGAGRSGEFVAFRLPE